MMEHAKQRRLRTFVSVPRGDGPLAEHVMFGPNDDVPEWAREKILNPKCWADDDEPEDPQPAAPTMIGGVYEPGSMISTPEVTTTGQLPPSSTPMAHPSRGSGRPHQAPAAGAEPGLAEARRRFGSRHDDRRAEALQAQASGTGATHVR